MTYMRILIRKLINLIYEIIDGHRSIFNLISCFPSVKVSITKTKVSLVNDVCYSYLYYNNVSQTLEYIVLRNYDIEIYC